VGKELVEKCEHLYERSGELAEGATRELSVKYRALHEHSKKLLEETETILRRAKSAAKGRSCELRRLNNTRTEARTARAEIMQAY
jgi:hypothetical protein